MKKPGMAIHSDSSFQDAEAVFYLSRVLESKQSIKTFFSANDKTPNHDGFFELVGPDSAPRKQFIVQIKTKESIKKNKTGPHKDCYYYSLSTKFLYYVEKRVTENPAVYFVVDRTEKRVFWLYLSVENLRSLQFEDKEKVPVWFTEENLLSDIDDFVRKMEEITRERNAKLQAWDTNKEKEKAWHKLTQGRIKLDDSKCLNNFIVTPGNEVAFHTMKAIAREPGYEMFNPLYLYGPSGIGKTHLLYAAANELLRLHPGTKIIFLKAEQFTNELITAIREGIMSSMREEYEQADALFLDDLQFIMGRESTQAELCHCIMHLCGRGKQVVLAGNSQLKDMHTLDEQLRSVFGSGVSMELNQADWESRVAMIQMYCREMRLPLSDEVVRYLADSGIQDNRHLIGIVKKLAAYHMLLGNQITREYVEEQVKPFLSERQIMPQDILKTVCDYCSVSVTDVKGKSRNPKVKEARQMGMFLLRKFTELRLPEIGQEFGRDHSTVLFAIQKIEAELKAEKAETTEMVQVLSERIQRKVK